MERQILSGNELIALFIQTDKWCDAPWLQSLWIASGVPLDEQVQFRIDSREVRKGDIFFALQGEQQDGHDYVNHAFSNGASLCVVHREGLYHGNVIVVKDTLKALHQLASLHLKSVKPMVIGLTGSSGKTTTKEWTRDLFETCYGKENVWASSGNLNTQTGLPLCVMNGLAHHHRYAIMEMGLDQMGDIDLLAGLFPPDSSALLNVGTAHVGNTGSVENTLEAKAQIIPHTPPDGAVVLFHDDPKVRMLGEICKDRKVWYFGEALPDGLSGVSIEEIDSKLVEPSGSTKITFSIRHGDSTMQRSTAIPTILHQGFANNMAAALTLFLSVSSGQTLDFLDRVKWTVPKMRFETKRHLGNWIVEDMYNANWESMRMALTLLEGFKTSDQVKDYCLVLGPIAELGNYSKAIHTQLGALINALSPRTVYIYQGDEDALRIAEPIENTPVIISANQQDLIDRISADYLECEDSLFFFKASRRFQLEVIAHGVVDRTSALRCDDHRY